MDESLKRLAARTKDWLSGCWRREGEMIFQTRYSVGKEK